MKSEFFTFILLSTLLHAVIISIGNEWIFSISKHHEQAGSFLDIEIISNKNSPTIRKNSITENKKETKKTPPEPVNRMPFSALPASASISKNTTVTQKIVMLKKNNLPAEKIELNKPTPTFTPEIFSNPEVSPTEKPEKLTTNSATKLNNNNKNENNEQLKTLLNNELEKYFYYPKSAQRKNRQGKVILAFTINSNGLIENIHISKSSGYRTLDNAAIKALAKVEANRDFTLQLNDHSTELTVPINYQLFNH